MNDLDEKTLRRIDWQELLPPVMLLRIFACATKMRVLFYAMAGMLLSIVLGCLLNFCVAHWRDSHDALSPDMFVTEESDEAFLTRLADHANQTIPPTIFQTPADIEALVGLDSAAQHQEQAKFLEAPARWLWECALRSVAIPWQFFSSAGISAGKAFFTLQEKNTLEIGCALLWLLMLVINWCLFGCFGQRKNLENMIHNRIPE